MSESWVLGQRALREGWRTPEALLPTLFIPLFFLVVNVGQAAKIFPSASTEFLYGQGYGAFQLPSSLLLAGSFGTAALFLVEEIEGGYFDKLRATPVSRSAIVLGRLVAEFAKALLIAVLMVILGLIFGITIASGVLGFVLLIGLTALWAVVFVGFMQLVALKTRSAAATNSAGLVFFPLLFLTPNFVPREMLTRPMEIAATLNPVTYVMESLRSLVLQDLDWASIWPGFLVVALAGALMLALNVRTINRYD
jgi:ABC-2 type transport system permease protein